MYPTMPWHSSPLNPNVRPVWYEALRMSKFSTQLLKERVLLFLDNSVTDEIKDSILSYPPQVSVAYSYTLPDFFFNKINDLEFSFEQACDTTLFLYNIHPHVYHDPAGNATLSLRFNNEVLEDMFDKNLKHGCTWTFPDKYMPYINLFKEGNDTRGYARGLMEQLKNFNKDFGKDKYSFDLRRTKIIIEEIKLDETGLDALEENVGHIEDKPSPVAVVDDLDDDLSEIYNF